MTKPTVDTLVRDIYKLMEFKEIPSGVDLDEQCEIFGQEMAQVMKDALRPRKDDRSLRLSAIGKPYRQQWNGYNNVPKEDIQGATYIKFLYGHLIESMILSLARISGHSVTGQQKAVEVGGVLGHIDGYIDGVLMDVKSCSNYGFKKFKKNELHLDDPFGYIGQLKAYATAEDQDTYGWLAMDKTSGQICWLQYHEGTDDAPYKVAIDYNTEDLVEAVKKTVVASEPPEKCYQDLPDGKSGNRKLAMGCSFCEYKHSCWPGLRTFDYSHGPKHMTVIAREPQVTEVMPEGF